MVTVSSISDSPHQPGPDFKFPKRPFGKTKIVHRAFQHSWFSRWKFCLKMFKERKNKTASKADCAFVSINKYSRPSHIRTPINRRPGLSEDKIVYCIGNDRHD